MSLKNEKLEIAVLASLIGNGNLLYEVSDILTTDCFTDPVLIDLWECIKVLHMETGAVSKVQLYHKFTKVRGASGDELKQNFIDIVAAHAGIANLGYREHVKTLVGLHQQRKLKEVLENALLSFGDTNSIDLSTSLISSITKIISDGAKDNSLDIKVAFKEIYDTVCSPEPSYKASTGLKLIDCGMGGGMQRGRVYSFLAPAKCGKTMMATTISNNLCDNGHKHLFVCAEMGSREISERMLGQRLNLPTKAFRERKDDKLINDIADQITGTLANVIFENEPGVELDRLKIVIEKHVHRNKIEGFILDYYQLVEGQQRNQSQAQHLEAVANWIHRVCKIHNIWCLLLVQANDEGKVLGSRGLDRACDQKYMIERPLDEQNDPIGNQAWLKMKLSRYTPLYNLGSASNPTLKIHENGTHFVEL